MRCRNAVDDCGIADLERKMLSQQLAKEARNPSARLRKPMKTNLIGYKCHVIMSCLGFEDLRGISLNRGKGELGELL